MSLRLFTSFALMSLMIFAIVTSTVSAQESVSQTCANLGFKPGSRGHTDCVNQNSGGRVAPKPANPAPAAKAPTVPVITAEQREDRFWEDAKAIGNREAFQGYLNSYPAGRHADLARASLASLKAALEAAVALKEDKFWDATLVAGNKAGFEAYLESYPSGRYVSMAKANLASLEVAIRPLIVPPLIAKAAGAVFKDCSDCPEMVVIPAGSFDMGGTGSDELPVHRVTLRSFAMGKTEVTQGQWRAVMGGNPSRFSNCGDSCPVEGVSWEGVKQFVSRLSAKTGKSYRLPSEAEWEYACRAGGREEYCGGGSVDSVAWHYGNSGHSTHPVAGKRPNAWGLHDMSGNVWEWTEDCWNGSYNGAPNDGSAWTAGNCSQRVVRGGSWLNVPQYLRAAYRGRYSAAARFDNFGFRVARTY